VAFGSGERFRPLAGSSRDKEGAGNTAFGEGETSSRSQGNARFSPRHVATMWQRSGDGEGGLMAAALLAVADVATLLGVSRATIYKLSASRELPSYRIASGAIRFSPRDVEACLNRRITGLGRRRFASGRTEPTPAQ
jgi:excisionase family DNA binding protein